MNLTDRDLPSSTALVADPNPTSRSVMAAQLRDLGVGTVVQCGRAIDARSKLECKPYDIVLCERVFPESGYTGQDLLDDLRRNNLLPFATVFIMVTSESGYEKVAEAAESALDIYLLKPYSATMLAHRILLARRRKRTLQPIFAAIESGDHERAALLCLHRFERRETFWLYAARIGAELLLRVGRVDEARKAYEAVVACQAVPWAKLGVARTHLEDGRPQEALRTLAALVGAQPDYVDAYDVMGRAQVEQGQLGDALSTYSLASEMTPGSVTRLQKHGMLAFYMGEHAQAAKALERAVSVGITSKVFDQQGMVLLAILRYLARDGKGLQRCQDEIDFALDRRPHDHRLQRFSATVAVFNTMAHKRVADAVDGVRRLADEIAHDDFDLEAATNLLTLVATLTAEELKLDDSPGWIERIGMRHAGTQAVTELLASAAQAHAPFAGVMHQCHQRVLDMAEQGVALSQAGDPRSAVLALMGHAVKTLNAKFIETAAGVLLRHRAAIAGADELSQRIEAFRRRWSDKPQKARLGAAEARAEGAMALRGLPMPQVTAPVQAP